MRTSRRRTPSAPRLTLLGGSTLRVEVGMCGAEVGRGLAGCARFPTWHQPLAATVPSAQVMAVTIAITDRLQRRIGASDGMAERPRRGFSPLAPYMAYEVWRRTCFRMDSAPGGRI